MATPPNMMDDDQNSALLEAGESLLDTDPAGAAARARQFLAKAPASADALRLLAAALRRLGDMDEANRAELAAIQASSDDPQLIQAANFLMQGRLPEAEGTLRGILDQRPADVAAIRMLAEIAARLGHFADAEDMLRNVLDRAPGFDYARLHLAMVLHSMNRAGESLDELDKIGPEIASYIEARELRASALARCGDYERAISLYRELAREAPSNVQLWTSLAFLLKTVGDEQGGVSAYRSALNVAPAFGDAWYGLADFKTVPFSDADVAAMEASIADAGTSPDDRLRIHFALGKAFEDRGEVDRAFGHYREGNAARAAQVGHEPERVSSLVDRSIELFTPETMKSVTGSDAPDPIFILGMPRSGSTLVEQIVASHPLVEGTAELPDIIVIATAFEPGGRVGGGWKRYPEQLAELPPEEFKRLGELYLRRTRVQRKSDRPFFIDKMPNNWLHIGLIKSILPNAKIIDTRRHPLACGFSNYKQFYARGQEYSYDLNHFGRYYSDYVRLMRHFDEVAPGLVHRVIHEELIEDPEGEVRRLLDYLGLEFDEACLRFHESQRPVRTASSQQVRQPIRKEAAEQWLLFSEYLDPLRRALGPALDNWKA